MYSKYSPQFSFDVTIYYVDKNQEKFFSQVWNMISIAMLCNSIYICKNSKNSIVYKG